MHGWVNSSLLLGVANRDIDYMPFHRAYQLPLRKGGWGVVNGCPFLLRRHSNRLTKKDNTQLTGMNFLLYEFPQLHDETVCVPQIGDRGQDMRLIIDDLIPSSEGRNAIKLRELSCLPEKQSHFDVRKNLLMMLGDSAIYVNRSLLRRDDF